MSNARGTRMLVRACAAIAVVFNVAGCSDDAPAPKEPVERSGGQSLTTSRELSLSLPKGVHLLELAASATNALSIGSNAAVVRPGGFAVVASSGNGGTDIGVSAQVGTVVSQGPVNLHNRALVTGDLTTAAASVRTGNGAAVTGTTETGAVLTPVQKFAWSIDFTSSSVDVFVAPASDRTLAPGAYRDVTVQPGATLRLSAGTYDLHQLHTAPNSRVVIDTKAGPAFIYVESALDTKEPIEAAGTENRIFLGYLGTGTVSIAAPFAGTVVAPTATLKLDPGTGGYRGSFFADTIAIGPRAVINAEAFASWDFVFPPVALLDCVARFDATHSNALWGYENPLDVPVTIPIGSRNQFLPPDVQPLTTFQPGRHEAAFWVPYSGAELTWSLGGATVTADGATRKCAFADLPTTPATPVDAQGEGSTRPRPSLLPLIVPNIFSGLSFGSVGAPARPAPFPPRKFKFIVDDQTFGSDAGCGPRQLYVNNVTVNGVAFPRRTFTGCTNPGACGVPLVNETFEVDVPPTQPFVHVHLDLWEVDEALCGGDDDHILALDIDVDNATGRMATGLSTFDPARSTFLDLDARCAKGADGFGICWDAEPSGSPRLCTAWNAQFIDAGPSPGFPGAEDFASTTDVQELGASFATAGYVFQAGASRFEWVGALDKDGCVPQDFVPPAPFWRLGGFSPLTIKLALATEHCFDPTGADCAPDASGQPTGARFRTKRASDLAPARLCTIFTQDPALTDPSCTIVRNFPGWITSPPDPIRMVNPTSFESTRIAAVVSQVLRVEAEGPGLGIREALINGTAAKPRSGDHGLIELSANDACCFRADGNCPMPECLRDGTCDTCASEPVKYRPDDQPPGQALVPGDTYWKFTVAHEMGHIIQARAMGNFFTDYNLGGATIKAPPKCSCDHVTSANTLHCLQSIEEPGAAQIEGFAQFFASRAWNRASENDCVFKYYKEFLSDTCLPGAGADGCVPVAGGLMKTLPPFPVSCLTPVRWRNNNCFDAAVAPGDLVTDFGVEYDWMGFLYSANTQGANTTSMGDVFGIYETACGGECRGSQRIAWEACTGCSAGVGGLRDASEQHFAVAGRPTAAAELRIKGDAFGVTRTTAR
jgi:hypothetical protein